MANITSSKLSKYHIPVLQDEFARFLYEFHGFLLSYCDQPIEAILMCMVQLIMIRSGSRCIFAPACNMVAFEIIEIIYIFVIIGFICD
jgi:hypothetical protein